MPGMLPYSWPRSCPRSELFRVRANGAPVPVLHTNPADFVVLPFGGPTDVEVEAAGPIGQVVVRPLSRGVQAQTEGRTARFALSGPAHLSIEIDGLKPLFLFADPPDEDPPDPDDPSVHYFRSGQIYEVGELRLQSGETLYIEGGAVVKGCVRATEARDVCLRGHGILDGSYYRRGVDATRTVLFTKCTGAAVRDVTIIQPTSWTVVFELCRQVHVRSVKEIAEGNGSDGIDIVSCRHVLVEGCFLRNGDDCVVVKARAPEDNPGWDTDVDDVLVRGCVVANVGGGNALEIGHELRTPSVRNITFRDCDVLCVERHGAVFSIHNSDRATVSDVLYENIRVEHYFTYLIEFKVLHSRWSRDAQRGQVRNVRLKDIRVRQSIHNPGYSISIIGGLDPEHTIEGVTIEDLYLDERKVTNADELDLYVKNASGVVIR